MDIASAEGLLDLRPAPFEADAAWACIASVHDPAYVDAVRTGSPLGLARSQGFAWSPAFADAVARIWAGHIHACQLALAEGLVLHPVSGAHHATRRRGAGFCTFNFLVGAARAIATPARRPVAIVDLDAHQGDGTYSLAAEDDGIAMFDIAGSRWTDTPPHPRHALHVVDSEEGYRRALESLPAFLDAVRPGLVQYQAGMDPFEDDPVGGIPGMTAAALRERDAFVLAHLRRRAIPTVVNLAGGYVEGVSEHLHVETIRVMRG